MHLFYTPQYTYQNRTVCISVLNGVLWDNGRVHCGILRLAYFIMSVLDLLGSYLSGGQGQQSP